MTTRKNFPRNVEARQKSAKERQEHWESLSPKQQLKALDERLGKGKGAKKQRARLKKARA